MKINVGQLRKLIHEAIGDVPRRLGDGSQCTKCGYKGDPEEFQEDENGAITCIDANSCSQRDRNSHRINPRASTGVRES